MIIDSFLGRAALAGVGLACAAGPLGCFVLWRRMAYFGDAIAHAAILGVALALAFSTSIFLGVVTVSLVMAVTVFAASGATQSTNTVLGVTAHSSLALGLVAASQLSGARLDLMSYLFGDILSVGRADLLVIWSGALAIVALLAWRWSALLISTLNPDLARASGINPERERLILVLALALVVAVAIKIVGALLISAMLIIPAAAARTIARSPERMAIMAVAFAILAVIAGLGLSLQYDTPAGPTIICAVAAIFIALSLAKIILGRHRRPIS